MRADSFSFGVAVFAFIDETTRVFHLKFCSWNNNAAGNEMRTDRMKRLLK
jgi:hypothetical protein